MHRFEQDQSISAVRYRARGPADNMLQTREERAMSIKIWINTVLVSPIKNNPAISLLGFGLLIYLFGIAKSPYLSDDIGKHLAPLGQSIVSAGVFSAILKSSQFSALFQEHILATFYDPAKILDNKLILDKWLTLTNSILRKILPISYSKVAEAIMARFFDHGLEYHFTDFEIIYNIAIDTNGDACLTNTLRADLVISPHCEKPIFTQEIESDSPTTLVSLIIGGAAIDLTKFAGSHSNQKGLSLKFNLLDYIRDDNRSVQIVRSFLTNQHIPSEPFISATISRLIKGAVIRTRITDGYRIRFISNGIELKDDQPILDGEGYWRWVLAKPGDLLLPGQGYTLVVVKN
jgi:hypothetical protein